MEPDLFFLRRRLPDIPLSKGYRWSLQVVKINETILGAYVAFRTECLAQRYAENHENVFPVAATELDSSHFTDFENRLLVLFESGVELEQCLTNRADYPYE